jgi:hypothetical protein
MLASKLIPAIVFGVEVNTDLVIGKWQVDTAARSGRLPIIDRRLEH